MTRTISAVLVFVLATSPAFAQSLQGSIRREAAAFASLSAQAPASPETRFPRPFLWTGIGLLAGGGLYVALASAVEDFCDNSSSSVIRCESNSGFLRGFGIGLAAAGAVVLAIGATKRKPSPEIVTTPGRGIAIRQKLTF
jgi:hypothetical protein